jgi:uncharacterized membrane protein
MPTIIGIFYGFQLIPIFSLVSTSLTGGLYSVSNVPLLTFGETIIPILAIVVTALIIFIMNTLAMQKLSKYYNESAIFRNSIYGLILGLVGIGLTVAVIIKVVLYAETSARDIVGMTTVEPMTGTMATLLVSVIFAAFVLELASAVFYMLAFHKLGNKSGGYSFNKAGTLYLIGIVMTIVVIGSFILWIGWIYSASGFNSLKPKALETPNPPNSLSTPPPPMP